jgi:2-alkenal reductase
VVVSCAGHPDERVGYRAAVSRRPLLVATVIAALVGGAVSLLVSETLSGDTVTTVLLPTQTETAPATVASAARPLIGKRFDPAAIYAIRSPGVVTIYADLGADGATQGSGFVVGSDGAILTNSHVITNVAETGPTADVRSAKQVFVEFKDGERIPAKIVGWDLFNDLGVLKVDPAAHRLQPVPLGNSDTVVVGAPVAAIGSPFGKQSSLAVGVVSATGRTIDSLTSGFAIADAIQVDAPINRGNSGGPLFDDQGRVIGINAQIQSTSGNAEGVGFAIPIMIARKALADILRTGTVAYAYVGVETQDVTPGMARTLGLPAERGALVTKVNQGTPAARSGIAAGSSIKRYNGLDVTVGGDVVVAIGETPVRSAEDIGRIVTRTLRPGQTVAFTVARDGGRVRIDVTLGKRPGRSG